MRNLFRNWTRVDQILSAAGVVLICGYFWALARQSLGVFFTPDDCMNLYRSWSFPATLLLQSNLLFFLTSPFLRPLGSVFYAAIYRFAGFHSHPYHAVLLVLLVVNIVLTYLLARRLADSRLAALLTAFLCAYQESFRSLYFDTGYIYDVLCYCFTLAAVLYYVRVRRQDRRLGPWEVAALCLLFVCALNAKEMAVILPLFLLGYEAVYRQSKSHALPLALCGVSLIFVVGRSLGSEALISNPAYRPVFTFDQFMLTSCRFLNDLLPLGGNATPAFAVALWVAAAVLAIASASRALQFAWLWGMLAPLPVAFVLPRGAPQYYVPLFGWALYAGALAALILRRLWIAAAPQSEAWAERTVAAALLVGLVSPCYARYRALGVQGLYQVSDQAPQVLSIVSQLHRLAPVIPHGSRMIFLDDPYPVDWENMLFIVRLSYNDDSLIVERGKLMKTPPALNTYNLAFDYRAGRFSLAREAGNNRPPQIFVASESGGVELAEAYHAGDWRPVTGANPARAGEEIIIKAAGLGATDCGACGGRPFPRNPLAHVVAAINANVNGSPAEVVEKLGWPGEVDAYRVDVRVPRGTPAGLASIRISEGGAWSEVADVPVG